MRKISFLILSTSFFYTCEIREKKPDVVLIKTAIPQISFDSVKLKKEYATDSVKIIDEFERVYTGRVKSEFATLTLKKIDEPNFRKKYEARLHFEGKLKLNDKEIKLYGWLYGCNSFNDSIQPVKVKNELGYLGLPLKWQIYENSEVERVFNQDQDGFIYEFLKLVNLEGKEDSLLLFGRFVNNEVYFGTLKSPSDSVSFSFKLSKKISENGVNVKR